MFITFEGIDGSGKSTQARMLRNWLSDSQKKEVLLTREPGGAPACEIFRELVLNGTLRHPWSEPFLFMLDRTEHAANVITPALRENKTVICERYYDSTLAYQVWGRGLDRKVLDMMFEAAALPVPDLTVYFSIEVASAVARIKRRGKLDSIESEGYRFMEKIKHGYDELSKEDPDRWLVIRTDNKSPEEIFNEVKNKISARGI